jgi:hypothetical protein
MTTSATIEVSKYARLSIKYQKDSVAAYIDISENTDCVTLDVRAPSLKLNFYFRARTATEHQLSFNEKIHSILREKAEEECEFEILDFVSSINAVRLETTQAYIFFQENPSALDENADEAHVRITQALENEFPTDFTEEEFLFLLASPVTPEGKVQMSNPEGEPAPSSIMQYLITYRDHAGKNQEPLPMVQKVNPGWEHFWEVIFPAVLEEVDKKAG